jgi:hypothetical protein
LRSSAPAADSAANQASRISAQFHADVRYVTAALRHHRPLVVLAVVLLLAAWWGARMLRGYYGRRWVTHHLVLAVIAAPATDFTLHRPSQRGRIRRAVRRPDAAMAVRVVRVELAGRTTTASYTELTA